MKNILSVAVLILIACRAFAIEDAYFCAADKSTGFQYNETTMAWSPVSFDATESKYLIKRRFPENDRRAAFGVFLLGIDEPILFCDVDEDRSWLKCHDTWYTYLRFHYETLRFIKYFEGSYALVPAGRRGNSSYIEIGRCNAI